MPFSTIRPSAITRIRSADRTVEAGGNYWLNALLLDEDHAHLRDTLLAETNQAGIATRPVWKPMHVLPMNASCHVLLSTSRSR